MKNDWLFKTDEYICGLRVAALIVRDNKVLVQKEKDSDDYALPGGHVKVGETLTDALIREISEEADLSIECRRLLWSEECFWNWNGKKAHHIVFYYLSELCDNFNIPQDEFIPQRDNSNVLIGWMPIYRLQSITIYPEFLKNQIFHLDKPIQHFISIS